nr:hypothetical protein [Tanacetum cinerariifolium]
GRGRSRLDHQRQNVSSPLSWDDLQLTSTVTDKLQKSK